MPEVPLDPSVAKVNPNFYSAAIKSNLDSQSKMMVEQFSLSAVKATELLKLSEKQARQEFLKLDPLVQYNIRYIHPDKAQFKEEKSILGNVLSATKSAALGTAAAYASPLIAGFKVAEIYGRAINTPYVAASQMGQGKPFSLKLLSDSYNSLNSWNWERIADFEKQYGKALITLVRGNIEGRTIGKSFDLYGKPFDDEMYAAVQFMNDEPEKFQNLLDLVKVESNISLGRSFANKAVKEDSPTINKNYWATRMLKKVGIDLTTEKGTKQALAIAGVKTPQQANVKLKKVLSAPVDAIYQIAIDPLTYVGVGPAVKAVTKGVAGLNVTAGEALKFVGLKTRGERMADQYKFIAEKSGDTSNALDWAFTQPEIINLWDEPERGLGALIKEYTTAESPTVKSMAWNKIKQDYPQWRDRGLVKLIGSEMKKTDDFNAVGAKRFFTQVDDFDSFLSGPVDGIYFRRDGIVTARSSRNLTSAITRTVYDTFNPTIAARSTEEAIRKNDEGLATIMETLKKVSDDSDVLVNPNVADIFELQTNVRAARKYAYQVGTGLSRSPGRILFGDDAIKTIESVRDLANQVMDTKFADALVELFIDTPPELQRTVVRNLYYGYMLKLGMNGTVGGKTSIDEILSKTFNDDGFTSTTRSEIPSEWLDVLEKGAIRFENEIPLLSSKGAIQPSQLTEGVAPLPYDLMYQYAADSKRNEKFRYFFTISGLTRRNNIKNLNDFWANWTLFPRSGPRSGIDETFFFYLYAPFYALKEFFSGSAIKPTRALTTITGSKASQGLYTRLYLKLMPKLDPTKKISPETRIEAVRELARLESVKRGYDVPEAEISMALIRENMVSRAEQLYKNTVSASEWKNIRKLMKHNPVAFESMINSMGARASISGKIDVDFVDSMFTPSNLTKMYQDAGLIAGNKYTAKQVSQMSETQIAKAHFDNWTTFFPYNSKKIVGPVVLDPVPVFFRNDALRTKDDFLNARNEILEKMGFKYSDEVEDFVIGNPTVAEKFLSKFNTTVYYRQQGIPDEKIAKIHIQSMLIDLRNTFHGGPNTFNDELFDLVKTKYSEIEQFRMKSKKSMDDKAWSNAAGSITYKDFEVATLGRHPVSGDINTRLISEGENVDMDIFKEGTGIGYFITKLGNKAMELMDATTTGMFRQKALWIFTNHRMNELVPYENMLRKRIEKQLIESGMPVENAKKAAALQAEKRTTEIAFKDSSEKLIEYVDNPSVKSNFAMSARSVARFYRSTEDFQRRIYRLYTKAPLRSIYRLRLLNTGLDAAGDVYEDENGEKFVIFPTDVILSSAVEPVLRVLTGNDSFKVPNYNELTLKLRLTNPSFSPDAGQPALSGPMGAVGVLIGRGLLRNFAPTLEGLGIIDKKQVDALQPYAEKSSDVLGKIGLGNFADSMTFTKAFTPMLLDTFGAALSGKVPVLQKFNEDWERQQNTAMYQAMAYFQAFGNAPGANATAEEKYEYIKGLRIGTSNIMFARTFLGYMSPGMPTFKESKDLPNYLKKVGITSFKAEFWDIYAGILRNSGDDVSNVFDLAVATFVGKNPGKIIYTVERTQKEYKVFINTTDNLKNWAIENKSFVDSYKEIAYIFAPKVGEYNPSVYNWIEAEGLIKAPELEDYLLKLQIAEDKQLYFGISKQLEEQLKTVGITESRKELIAIATQKKKMLLNSNPFLQAEIEGSVNDRGVLKTKFKTLNEAINSSTTPVDKQTRKAMKLILEEVADFVLIGEDSQLAARYDYTEIKEQRKAEIVDIIDKIAKANPAVAEANRLIFKPLLNTYSREAISAGPTEVNR